MVKALQDFKAVAKLERLMDMEAEAVHELLPSLVAFISTTIDHPASDLMAIFLELPLDIVSIVEGSLTLWLPNAESPRMGDVYKTSKSASYTVSSLDCLSYPRWSF